MGGPETIGVELVYALPERQILLSLRPRSPCTAEQAIAQSGLADSHPELDWRHCPLAIFGRLVGRDRLLADGDRLELLRPLVADPMQRRRERAAVARKRRQR